MGGAEEGPSQEAAPITKKRKLGTMVGKRRVSDNFVVELMDTCTASGGRMSSHELRESSARMLEVTGSWWPENLPIPWAEGEDMSTSRIARGLKIFPYGWNVAAAVVSAAMNKDRQDAAVKRRAVVRLPEARPKRARGGGVRRLSSPAVASLRWLQRQPRLDLASCRRARRRPALAGPSPPRRGL
jgi:hypothetical protein